MRRKFNGRPVWPSGLQVCVPAEWLLLDEDIADVFTARYRCWHRWVNARYDFLRSLGMAADDALLESVGDFPSDDRITEVIS